ncbi:hypothetical protein XFF6994_940033 [Xanthomonas citri pv. fuscans]|nr:hypothetical protein XFF6994_940033 [Xanthomonas citri pv. fuscans]
MPARHAADRGETAATQRNHLIRRRRCSGCFEGPHPCPSLSTFQKHMTATGQKQSVLRRVEDFTAADAPACAQVKER